MSRLGRKTRAEVEGVTVVGVVVGEAQAGRLDLGGRTRRVLEEVEVGVG